VVKFLSRVAASVGRSVIGDIYPPTCQMLFQNYELHDFGGHHHHRPLNRTCQPP
jgi:hypothetical protein